MDHDARPSCPRCRRPASACFCAHLASLESRTRVCFLQHPRETRVAIGTARMAHLSLPNSELHSGIDFTHHAEVRALAASEGCALLFPGEGAVEPATLVDRPPKTLIVVDGTWALAGKVVKRNEFLRALPRIGLVPPRPSNYRIRKEPAEHCVSTIEAVAHVLGALEGAPEKFLPMLDAFDRMVDLQLAFTARHPNPSRSRRKRTHPSRAEAEVLELRAARSSLVVVHAEANAYPVDAGVEGPAELLHLVAHRPATGETFESVLAPRRPLAPNAPLHVELPAGLLLAGESVESCLARFAGFLGAEDVLGTWGRYVLDLLAAERAPARRSIDLRLLASRRLKRRTGGVEQAFELLTQEVVGPALAPGRAGRRLTALAGLIAPLCTEPAERGASGG